MCFDDNKRKVWRITKSKRKHLLHVYKIYRLLVNSI